MSTVISPVSGTRTEPKDAYSFVKGTTATFKITFTNNDVPSKVDTLTFPIAKILNPRFLSGSGSPVPEILATLVGALVPGQEFEYQFTWDVPANITPNDEYVITYEGILGTANYNFGDEFFQITAHAGQIGTTQPAYATVDEVREVKFNIDDFLPDIYKKDLTKRNNLIQKHLVRATSKLREELALFRQRGFTENFKLFVIYRTIYTILLGSRGEDGSAVSDQNILFWKQEYTEILNQEKRKGAMQGIPMGRG